MTASLDEFIGALCMNPEQFKLYVYGELNYIPPRILFASKPSILVMIDGVPHLKLYREWGVKVVVNTPLRLRNRMMAGIIYMGEETGISLLRQ